MLHQAGKLDFDFGNEIESFLNGVRLTVSIDPRTLLYFKFDEIQLKWMNSLKLDKILQNMVQFNYKKINYCKPRHL
jgi:hypothetical protein